MKGIIIFLFVVLAIVLIGGIFSVFYLVNQKFNQDTTPDETQQQDQTPDESQENIPPSSEPQEEELSGQISVSTKEELFQEIRNAVNKHLNQ